LVTFASNRGIWGGQSLEAEVARNLEADIAEKVAVGGEEHVTRRRNPAFQKSKAKEVGISETLNVHTSGGLAVCC